MIVYTCGYMQQGARYDWRAELVLRCRDVEWLHPDPFATDARIFALRDWLLVKRCDVLFAYVNTNEASNLGTMLEIGIAFALSKPIIMVDKSPENKSLDMAREYAGYVCFELTDGIKCLKGLL